MFAKVIFQNNQKILLAMKYEKHACKEIAKLLCRGET
jgi:hypothetical protein